MVVIYFGREGFLGREEEGMVGLGCLVDLGGGEDKPICVQTISVKVPMN